MDCRSWMVAIAALVAPAAWNSPSFADCGCAPKSCVCEDPCAVPPGQSAPYYSGPHGGPDGATPRPPVPPLAQDGQRGADGEAAVPPMADGLIQPADDLPALPSPASSFASASQLAMASEGIGFRDSTIGDFFGSSSLISGPSYDSSLPEDGFNVPVSGSDRRFKLSENISPIPVDRWFVNYNHFEDPIRNINGDSLNVDRVTFGLEKTFLEGAASLEVRAPLVGGLQSSQSTVDDGDQTGIEFGNMTFTLKGLFRQDGDRTFLTGGLGINVPTADDGRVTDDNDTLLRVDNESVHLLPFMALYHRLTPRTFLIGVVQADFDANGNRFWFREDGGSGSWTSTRFQEQHLLYFDLSGGHWFYEDYTQTRLVRRIAAIGELHYTTTLNDTDSAQAGPSSGDMVTNPYNRLDVLNGTAGLRFQLGYDYLLTTAAIFPLKGGENELFDHEIAILLTKRF